MSLKTYFFSTAAELYDFDDDKVMICPIDLVLAT
jgi:hypothetical protein